MLRAVSVRRSNSLHEFTWHPDRNAEIDLRTPSPRAVRIVDIIRWTLGAESPLGSREGSMFDDDDVIPVNQPVFHLLGQPGGL